MLWFVPQWRFFSRRVTRRPDALPPAAIALRVFGALLMVALGIFSCFGFFTLEPNEARVLMLFGAYKGTVRSSGFHWANPLYARSRGAAPSSAPVPRCQEVARRRARRSRS